MFKQKKKTPTQNAIGFHDDGISYVSVTHEDEDKPRVSALDFIECDNEEYSQQLSTLVKKYKLKKSSCTSFLRLNDYKLVVVEAPAVPEEDLADALKWEIKDKIGYPLDEVTIDVFPVPMDASNQQNINVIAAKKDVISDRVALFKAANLSLNIIDIEDLALRNIAITQEKEKQGSVFVALRKNHGLVLFCKAGELHFSRRLVMGYDILNDEPAQINSVALEIQRSIDYFDRHFANVGINNLILFPFMGDEEGAVDFLNKNLSVSCSLSDLNQGIEWGDSIDRDMQLRCLLALGAALRDQGATK